MGVGAPARDKQIPFPPFPPLFCEPRGVGRAGNENCFFSEANPAAGGVSGAKQLECWQLMPVSGKPPGVAGGYRRFGWG